MTVIADDRGPARHRRHHRRRGDRLHRRRRPKSSSRPPISIRCAPPRPAASSASSPTRATASSAASIRPSSSRAPRSPRRMILELCGGEASELVIAGERARRRSAATAARRPREDAGRHRCSARASRPRILTALGFGVSRHRGRLAAPGAVLAAGHHGEADLVEEVCRIVGLDNVPPVADAARSHAVPGRAQRHAAAHARGAPARSPRAASTRP